MNNRRQVDQVGEVDKDRIAQWYRKCRVRREGSIYIATPHTTNPTRRSKRIQESIAVSVQDDKYIIADEPLSEPMTLDNVSVEQSANEQQKSPQTVNLPPAGINNDVRVTTRKQVFDELYDKYSGLLPHKRKQAILTAIQPLFNNADSATDFVHEHWCRKYRNYITRKLRFEYKALNQNYEYFFTITYDSKKHSEESFEKCLKDAFSNLHKRYGCLFQGVWEHGDEHGWLHFHGLISDPNGKITKELETATDYNPQTGRKRTYLQSKYFAEKFGRNEFSEIIPPLYASAIGYITKYLSKHDVKPYYSKGLYRFIESDICGDDVLCPMDDGSGRDLRLIVSNKFTIWQEGVKIGEVSPETIAQSPKLP